VDNVWLSTNFCHYLQIFSVGKFNFFYSVLNYNKVKFLNEHVISLIKNASLTCIMQNITLMTYIHKICMDWSMINLARINDAYKRVMEEFI